MSDSDVFPSEESFFALGEYFEDEVRPIAMGTLLGLSDDQLKPLARRLLSVEAENPAREILIKLTGAFRAYSQFQDLLDVSVEANEPLLHRHFCYYESVVYLREALRSLFDGNTLAALSLLRPYQELATYHLYWYTRAQSKSYKPYYRWLDSGEGKPAYSRALDEVIMSVRRENVVEKRRLMMLREHLTSLYKSACSYVHAPTIEESIVGMGQTTETLSPQAFFFAAHSIELRIRQLCYLYVLVYPMTLFPVRMHEKWGFGGPIGLFARHPNSLIVEDYLGVENVGRLRERLKNQPVVIERLQGFESVAALTEEELERSWLEFANAAKVGQDPFSLEARLAIERAHSRALGWTFNYLRPRPSGDEDDVAVQRLMERIESW